MTKLDILHATNLRAELQKHYQNVTLEVLVEQHCALNTTEQHLLQITEPTGYLRAVNILGDGVPIVYAKTLMGYTTYIKHKSQLDNLGNNFLGDAFLYKLAYTRTEFEFITVAASVTRQSIFNIKSDKILLLETFL